MTKTRTRTTSRTRDAGKPRRGVTASTPTAGTRVTRRPRAKRPAGGTHEPLPKAVTVAVTAAYAKKATDVVVLDLREAGGFTDYFLICTGDNTRQIGAIADAIRDSLKREFDERPVLAEGLNGSEWILVDYFDFVVHIFSRECRAFYDLERLWGNANRVTVSDGPPR